MEIRLITLSSFLSLSLSLYLSCVCVIVKQRKSKSVAYFALKGVAGSYEHHGNRPDQYLRNYLDAFTRFPEEERANLDLDGQLVRHVEAAFLKGHFPSRHATGTGRRNEGLPSNVEETNESSISQLGSSSGESHGTSSFYTDESNACGKCFPAFLSSMRSPFQETVSNPVPRLRPNPEYSDNTGYEGDDSQTPVRTQRWNS